MSTKSTRTERQILILAITFTVLFASFTFPFVLPEALYQGIKIVNSLFIPSSVRECLTPVIPVKDLPKSARFINSFHFIVEENGKLHITKLKIYTFQNDYYAVLNNATLKAGYPQACEKYYATQAVADTEKLDR